MSLQNIDKNHLNSLLSFFTNNNHNQIEIVKKNHVQYSQLKLLNQQMNLIKQQALDIINDANTQEELHNLKTNFKKTSGNCYYLYQNIENEEKYFSLISPSEWGYKYNDTFIGKFYYDFDKTFIKVEM